MEQVASVLAPWIRRVSGMYINDLKALPVDAFTECPGGCARTPQEYTGEVAGMNFVTSKLVSGEISEFPMGADRPEPKLPATVEEGCQMISASGEALASAVETYAANLGNMTKAPWGEEMTLAALANVAANHIMYHDGQLTYYQSLKGDSEMHWFD